MQVRKRNGALEPVDVNKIVRAVQRCCHGLPHVDAIRVASKTIGGLFDGASTRELDSISIQTAASLIAEEPEYSRLAARLLLATIAQRSRRPEHLLLLAIHRDTATAKASSTQTPPSSSHANARKLNNAIDDQLSDRFEYFGLRTVYDRYLLRHPITRASHRDAAILLHARRLRPLRRVNEAVDFYNLLASHDYLPSSPTLFNSRHQARADVLLLPASTRRSTRSTRSTTPTSRSRCFRNSPAASASPSTASAREGSLIRATNGLSNGIVPWLRTLDASVAAVNQGGKRKGACCVYLEPWHADVESFLEMRDNTGDQARRTYNLNLANWIPDLFMRRVDEDGMWSLFDPKDVPHLTDLYGEAFERSLRRSRSRSSSTRARSRPATSTPA